jgi:hypothetical protein
MFNFKCFIKSSCQNILTKIIMIYFFKKHLNIKIGWKLVEMEQIQKLMVAILKISAILKKYILNYIFKKIL